MPGSLASLASGEAGCIGEDDLLSFVHGSLDDDRRSAIRAHVDGCDDCRELLAIAGREAAARGDVIDDDAPISESPVALGETVEGRFLVEREIGRGGMGVVYAAKHLALNRSVALKVMGQGLAKDDEAVRRFLRESRVASKLESPHVVTVFDVGRLRSGAPYMVMELLDGENLEQVVRRDGPLEVERAVTYVMQACDALGEAHAGSVVHRDVKLENIFLVRGPEPMVKVLDFGLATGGRVSAAETSLTRSNAVMGTPRYMSPEQLGSARDVDARTDVWALGVCLYRLVTRRYPYDAPHFAALCVKIATANPKKPSLARPDLPRAVEEVIMRALAREPAKRYQDARALGAALAQALATPLGVAGPLSSLIDPVISEAAPPSKDPQAPFASTQMRVATVDTRHAPPFLDGNERVQPGAIIAGKYRVDRVLGVGGMGIVVAVTHLDLGELYALKFLHPSFASDPEVIARFMREAQAAARIKSELTVRVSDVGKLADGSPFLVMEHLVGEDLARRVQVGGPLPVAEAVDYVLQACAGVAEAHAIGIVHRDLKPSNLFLTRRLDGSPLVKVLDFGISKALSDSGNPSLTHTREVFGSPAYMSPEQIRSAKNVDVRTDVWALGVILHELLTGVLPFDGTTPSALLAAVSADVPRSTREARPEVSEALDRVVRRCLEKAPDARFSSVAELACALEPFGSGACSALVRRFTGSSPSLAVAGPPRAHTTDPSVAAAAATGPSPVASRWPMAAFLALAGVVVLAGAGYFAMKARSAPSAPRMAAAEAVPSASALPEASASSAPTLQAPVALTSASPRASSSVVAAASAGSAGAAEHRSVPGGLPRGSPRAGGGAARSPVQASSGTVAPAAAPPVNPANDPWSTSH